MLPAWHPDEYLRRKPYLEARGRMLNAMRGVFCAEDFAEVETPILQISPGNEPHLHAFATQLRDPYGGAQNRYLHTSPEFAMKKLLAAGVPRLYQFAHAFRNGERSSLHHPEFTMLEWYRAGADTRALMQDCVTLIRAAANVAGKKIMSANGAECDLSGAWEEVSVADAFQHYVNIDILATAPDPQKPDIALLAAAARKAGMRVVDGDTWEDIFFRILGENIEPQLGKNRPAFLCDYPISQAALAKVKPDNPRLVERFELYICGWEIANAFHELTDADEQKRRFEAAMQQKQALYGERYPVDEDFIAALRHMPPSAGIALGFDRLVMLVTGAKRIDDVLWLPVA